MCGVRAQVVVESMFRELVNTFGLKTGSCSAATVRDWVSPQRSLCFTERGGLIG
jgi:hypothetical protein